MVKYFCDACGKEVNMTPKINALPIATVETIDPATGKRESQMCCTNCTPKLKEFIQRLRNEKGIIKIGDDLSIKIK